MAPLIILIVGFVLIFLINNYILNRRLKLSVVGRMALAMMLIFTAIAHFTKTDLMVEMLPELIPLKKQTIYFTDILEFIASFGLLIRNYAKTTSIILFLFFLAILPANIVGSLKEVQLGGMQNGVGYLIFRIPLQLLFIGWTYYFGIRLNNVPANF
ncbi:hypothetical protein DHD05_05935 [Arenibacter sp. N53]|uniref:DoxX family protein n=1 Tax=Arenibacter TaxID=178469 RepID=UPI000CD4220F|nr:MULTISPECIES: hypothetical protein [Arenibacter]MCM4151126.1 hypothetical protein [Arenibacter sp. N53]